MRIMLARVVLLGVALSAGAYQADPGQADASPLLQFQRAADTYAFAHRQDDRRGTTPARLVEGQFFTPSVAASFRARIRSVTGCSLPRGEGGAVVPSVNAPVTGASPLPSCLASALPRLPEELEYRSAGVALILADAHRGIVVDVLHAAFP
jgi:hypothetical protein